MKILTILSVAAMAVAACSCSSRSGSDSDRDVTYSWTLPAADAEGIRCTLHLDYDDSGTKGDYDLTEKYIVSGKAGGPDASTFTTEGDFTVNTGTPANPRQRYIKLMPEGDGARPIYFVIDSDNTVTMTGPDLVVSDSPGLNYTLVRQ